MRRLAALAIAIAIAVAVTAPSGVTAATAAGATLPLGRYKGTTGDGHVIEFTVARRRRPSALRPRKITHFHVVYDIAGCWSGPIRQASFTTVTRRGRFARD